MEKPNKIFISYSWTTPIHEQWVINLAERLMADGVDVVIDKWYLKEGNDKYSLGVSFQAVIPFPHRDHPPNFGGGVVAA